MPVFFADTEKCRQDGICASVCPLHVIRGPKGAFPTVRRGQETACIACGHCVAYCPHQAAHVERLDDAETLAIRRKELPSPEAVELLCKTRRSTRRFKKEPVPRETIARLLETARYAPSAKNRMPVRWLVLYDAARLREAGDCIAGWLREIAPLSGDAFPEAAAMARAWRSGLDPIFRGAPHVVLAVTPKSWKWGAMDAAVALTYLELLGHALGIGMCWAGYVTTAAQAHAPLRELLGIGKDEKVVGGQMLGFPALRPTSVPPRRHPSVSWL